MYVPGFKGSSGPHGPPGLPGHPGLDGAKGHEGNALSILEVNNEYRQRSRYNKYVCPNQAQRRDCLCLAHTDLFKTFPIL